MTKVTRWPVSMTVRFHLFPFRTQKLSSLVPKIVGWKRPVKIGRCRLLFLLWPVGQAVKTAASHAVNIGSNPVRVTIFLLTESGKVNIMVVTAKAVAI